MREDRLLLSILVAVILIVAAAGGYSLWFHSTHRCVETVREWHEASRSCAPSYVWNGDQMMYAGEICVDSPAHEATVCVRWERQ